MNEFNQLYEYSKDTLKLVKYYQKDNSDNVISMIDRSLKNENKYLSLFSLNSLKQLLALIDDKLEKKDYNFEKGLENDEEVLILKHMHNSLISELLYADLFDNNYFNISRHDANLIIGNPMIDGIFNIGMFLNKCISTSLSDFFNECDCNLVSEYYIYTSFYNSFTDVLNHKRVELEWEDNSFMVICLFEVFNDYISMLNNKVDDDVDFNRFLKLINNLPKDYRDRLIENLGIGQILSNKKKMVTYTPLNETISYRFIIDSKVKDNPYKYDYEVALKYSVLIDKLLNNSNSIYELINDLMFSNSNTKAKCIESIHNCLRVESELLESLDDYELNAFINYFNVCYMGNFDIIDCYCNFVNNGVISDVNFRNVSVRRILCRLFEFREELVFDNYIFLKLNQLLYLNTISELFNIRHLDVKDSAFRDKIAYLLLYSNGLEDYLVRNNNMFQFNYDYNQIKNDPEYNLGIKLLLADARQVKDYDREKLMMKCFVDCFWNSVLKFIDPAIISDANNKGDVSKIKLSKTKDKE